jgi:hypothetical protein
MNIQEIEVPKFAKKAIEIFVLETGIPLPHSLFNKRSYVVWYKLKKYSSWSTNLFLIGLL